MDYLESVFPVGSLVLINSQNQEYIAYEKVYDRVDDDSLTRKYSYVYMGTGTSLVFLITRYEINEEGCTVLGLFNGEMVELLKIFSNVEELKTYFTMVSDFRDARE